MKSRWRKRILVLLSITLVGLGIPVASELYARSKARADLEKIIGELDQNDPRWRLDDIEADRKPVPPDQNSAETVLAAYRLLPKDWDSKILPRQRPLDPSFEEWHQLLLPPSTLDTDFADKLAGGLKPLEGALQIARKLKDQPWGRFPIEYSPDWISSILHHNPMIPDVAKLLTLDVLFLLQQKDMVKAWESHRALLNAVRSTGDEPVLISVFIRLKRDDLVARSLERALAQGEFQASQLAERQNALETEMAEPLFLNGMRGERAGFDQFLSNIESGKIFLLQTLKNAGKKNPPERGFWDPFNEFFAFSMVLRSHVAFLDLETKVAEALKQPGANRYKVVNEVGDSIRQMSPKDETLTLTRLLFPDIKGIASAEKNAHTRMACAVAGLAAERFRLKNNRWPESLKELVETGFLKQIPIDLYDDTNNSLRLRRAKDGLVIYSVGKLSKDYDGTALDDLRNLDPTQLQLRVEFRLWDPAHRRQPPNRAKAP